MTLHVPHSRARVAKLVARRILLRRRSAVAVIGLAAVAATVTGKGSAPQASPVGFGASQPPARLATLRPSLPSTALHAHRFEVASLSPTDLPDLPMRLPRPSLPSLLPDEAPLWEALDDIGLPRLPDAKAVAIVPKGAAARNLDTVPEIDGEESRADLQSLLAGKGDTIDGLLQRAGVREEDRRASMVALRAEGDELRLAPGDRIDVAFVPDAGDLAALRLRMAGRAPIELRWDGDTAPLWAALSLSDGPEAPTPAPKPPALVGDAQTAFFGGTINSSLYASAQKAGLNARHTQRVIEIFRYAVDFERDLRKGDRFEALFEREADGSLGKILYARLDNRGTEIALYRHEDANGTAGYFDATGRSSKRSLMRTPVVGGRISSRYGMRRHPILGYNKMHRGVDFAVATGTPIVAAGDGVVEYAGWRGSYGKYVRIRHTGTYETAYAHLSKIPGSMSPGRRVRQGDVIGYVGSTGRSTGPHLHFEVLEHGAQVDPHRVADFGPVEGLGGPALASFKVKVARVEVALGLLRDDTRVATAD